MPVIGGLQTTRKSVNTDFKAAADGNDPAKGDDLIYDLFAALVRSSTRRGYLDAAVELLQQRSGCRCVGIRVVDRENGSHAESFVGYSRELWNRQNSSTPDSLFASAATIPFAQGESLIGAIQLADERPSRLAPATLRTLERVAPLLAESVLRLSSEESAARASESRFRLLAENARDVIYRYELSPTRGFSYVSPAMTGMTGYKPEECYADPNLILRIVHPGDRHLLEALVVGWRLGQPITTRWQHKDGHTIWVEQVNTPVRGEAGNLVAVEGIARDVTRRALADETLRQSEERYRGFLEAIDDAIHVEDAQGRYVMANSEHLRRLDLSIEDVLGKTIADLGGDPLVALRMMDLDQRVLSTGEPVETEEEFKRGPRSRVEHIRKVPLRSSDGTVIGIVTVSRDISARKRAEVSELRKDDELRRLAEGARDVIFRFELTPAIRTSYMSPAIAEITGYSPEEFYADPYLVWRITHPEDFRELELLMSESGTSRLFTFRMRHKDGRTVWVQQQSAIVRDDAGQPIGVEGIARDVTGQRQIDEQFLKERQLETTGRIAGQVAHDFNNLMGPLALYPDLIRMELPEGHRAAKYCDAMLEAVRHMAEINSDMLALAKRGHVSREIVDLNALVGDAVQQISEKPDGLTVDLDLDASLAPINGSGTRLLRVVANLISNARDAMEDNGSLGIKTENFVADGTFSEQNGVNAGPYVRLSISDTGPGIRPEILEKVFEPFFTTKTDTERRNSGLGLSLVQAIVEDHSGCIQLETEEGKGARFIIYLPAMETAPEPKQRPKAPEKARPRILVVDDDPLQRGVLKEALLRLDYDVETVASGEKAVEYVRENEVDLMITDMVLPGGIDGVETYRRVSQERPGIKALIMSGYSDSEQVRETHGLGAGRYIRKPIRLETLAQAVGEALKG